MQVQRITARQLRKSIYSELHNPEHKKFILDTISQKIGRENLAYLLMIVASIAYPLGFLYTNENKFNPVETSLLRGLCTLVINYIIVRHYKIQIDYSDRHNLKYLMIRNLIMTLQGLVYIAVQFYLTQPIIQTLNSSGTLFIFLLDYLINGITVTKKQFYGIIVGVFGVLLTVNGEFIMRSIYPNYTTTTQFKNYSTDNPFYKVLAALAFLFTQFIWGYGVIVTKKLRQVNSIQINFHLGFLLSISSALVYPHQVTQQIDLMIFLKAIFCSGLLMVLGQICFIGSVTMIQNTGVLTMLGFISVILGYFVSVFKYKEQINIFCIIGAILILFGLGKILLKDNEQKSTEIKQGTSQK